MARQAVKLTKRLIDGLTTDKKRGEMVFDTEVHGLAIRVWPSGRRSFTLDYGPRNRRRRVTVGHYGVITLAEARRKASRMLSGVQDGVDPLDEQEDARKAPTVAEWISEYLERVADRKRSVREDRRYLGWASERWGRKKLASLKASDVQAFFDSVKERGHTAANRALASIRACLSEAWRQGLLLDNVARRVRPLPEAPPRSRVLNDEELGRLVDAIDAITDPFVQVGFILLLETGSRQSEVLRAKWEDFDLTDLDNALWRVPRPKSGEPVVKPLTRTTAETVNSLPRESRYVIAGRKPDRPRADLKRPWYRLLSEAGLEGLRLHDLRRTFGLAVAKKAGLHLASKLLGHTTIRVTEKVYSPLGVREQREAAEQVQRDREAKVLPFRRRANGGEND